MSLSSFALFVICFNLLVSVLGFLMPWIIEFEAQAKFRDFHQLELTEACITNFTHQKMPEIVIGTTLSFIGTCLGYGLLKRRAWAREGWLALCLIWVAIPVIGQIVEPDLSLPGLAQLMFRIVILIVSGFVLFNAAVIREFHSASSK